MITRREVLITASAGAVVLAAPNILRARAESYTPVVSGKRVRRKLSTLEDDDPFFAAYADAVTKMHELDPDDPRSWISQARIHADFCEHASIEFFSWHRPYLHYFEKICGELIGDENFALPYWDWRDNQGRLPQAFFEDGPLNVTFWNDPGQYNAIGWGSINTNPYRFAATDFGLLDGPAAGDFSNSAMDDMENASNFDLLTELTEGPHGTAHVVVGGNAVWGLGTDTGHFSSGLSPLDPIFWLHHANVDRIWANSAIPVAQQKTHIADLTKKYEDVFFDEAGNSVTPEIDETFELDNYGYTYDFIPEELLSEEVMLLNNQITDTQSELIDFANSRGIEILDPGASSLTELSASSDVPDTYARGIARISLEANAVADSITSQRLSPRTLPGNKNVLALENGKIYARFEGVQPKAKADGSLIKVFVNCPYLSSLTPTTDPHYAGSICLFGCNPDVCGQRTFTVDITEAVQNKLGQGVFALDKLELQLLPFASEDASSDDTLISTERVRLLST